MTEFKQISDPSRRPMSRRTRIVLAVYGVLMGLTGVAVLTLILQTQQRADREVQQVSDRVFAELDRRTAERNRANAERDLQQRQLICAVLAADFTPSDRTRALALSLQCPPIPEAFP